MALRAWKSISSISDSLPQDFLIIITLPPDFLYGAALKGNDEETSQSRE